MKAIFIATLLTGIVITDFSGAQTTTRITKKDGLRYVTVHCEDKDSKETCDHWTPPPAPPAPPAPPTISAPPAVPTIPALPMVPPTPPAPPAPPPLPKIPEEIHAACAGKADGQHLEMHIGKTEFYSGNCIKKNGTMRFDANYISISHSKHK